MKTQLLGRRPSFVLWLVLPGLLAGAGSAFSQEANLTLEEIVVTAERRESTLQDVPLAVSAFDANEIERRQAFNVKDVVKQCSEPDWVQ